MFDDQSPIDELSELLARSLSRISLHLQLISEGRMPEDLEPLISQLDEEAVRLDGLVASLGICLETPKLCRSEIDLLVRRISSELLSTLDAPVVIRTNIAENLPDLTVQVEPLEAALRRAMVLAAGHAGPGGELTITVRAQPKAVVFELASVAGSTPIQPPTYDRCKTLQEFIETLGGHCSGELDDKQIMRLVLELAAEVEHA